MKKPPINIKDTVAELLSRGMTTVAVNPDFPGADVPAIHKNNRDALVLNLSYRFEAEDLNLGENEITTTLSFEGKSRFCRIPYKAITAAWLASDKQGVMFGPEVPATTAPEGKKTKEEKAEAKPKFTLRLIKGGKDDK